MTVFFDTLGQEQSAQTMAQTKEEMGEEGRKRNKDISDFDGDDDDSDATPPPSSLDLDATQSSVPVAGEVYTCLCL